MFSVILPVYNGARYVDDAISSVFGQSERDWELIVINDGSTDNTDEVLKKYRGSIRVKCIKQENRGAAEAKGE